MVEQTTSHYYPNECYPTVMWPYDVTTLIARFMGPTWGPSEADRTQVGPMLVPWIFYLGRPQGAPVNAFPGKQSSCCSLQLSLYYDPIITKCNITFPPQNPGPFSFSYHAILTRFLAAWTAIFMQLLPNHHAIITRFSLNAEAIITQCSFDSHPILK